MNFLSMLSHCRLTADLDDVWTVVHKTLPRHPAAKETAAAANANSNTLQFLVEPMR
jgi:hypothetical protein